MRTLIGYESLSGNTRHIAESIVDGFGPGVTTTVVDAASADPPALDDVDLVVVGAPTHALGLPTPRTRDVGREPGSADRGGVREWLDRLPMNRSALPAVTFDTRLARPKWLTGSAARRAARILRRRGFRIVATEGFLVEGTEGPLRDGEVERARSWAARLVDRVQTARG